MALKQYGPVRETSTTGGTGDQVLAGRFDSSYFEFSERYSDGENFFYVMKQGTSREEGKGAFVASGDKVARTQVYKSTNSNNLVNFTNGQTIDIFVTEIAPDDLDDAGRALLSTAKKQISFAASQSLTAAQKAQANSNLAIGTRTVTGADTVVTGDRTSLILCNSASAFSLAFSAAATLGNGFSCRVRNINTGLVTLDPNSSETINGRTTMTLGIGEELVIDCDGAALYASTKSGDRVLLGSVTASASATIDFANVISAEFSRYVLELDAITPATDDVSIRLRVGTGAGPTYQTTNYSWGANRFSNSPTLYAGNGSALDSASDAIYLSTPGPSNGVDDGGTASGGYTGDVDFAFVASKILNFRMQGTFTRSDGAMITYQGGGQWQTATTITSLRLLASSGNIGSGKARLYGYRDS